MASTPGQNVHLLLPHNQVLVSSFLTYCLVVPLLVYSSTRRITFQLVMSPFNSSCNDLVHCSWKKRGPKGPGYYN